MAELRKVIELFSRGGVGVSGWSGLWPERSRPRRVEGGVRARSRRGAIGEQWWSRRFIDVLESWTSGGLARGRNYARTGQVIGFELTTGYVTAQVQGSRPRPYRVRIQVLPLTARQWERAEQALAAQALFRAKLLAGEMPHEIEDVFADCGTPLFPRSARDMEMSCSCPDWEVPCKHLAAVCYVLAEAFDDDPFAMLAWRGRGREELLAALRRITAGQPEPPGPVITVTDRPLAESLDQFYLAGAEPGEAAGHARRGSDRSRPPAPLLRATSGSRARPGTWARETLPLPTSASLDRRREPAAGVLSGVPGATLRRAIERGWAQLVGPGAAAPPVRTVRHPGGGRSAPAGDGGDPTGSGLPGIRPRPGRHSAPATRLVLQRHFVIMRRGGRRRDAATA